MAREHARIYTAVWREADWKRLPVAAQHTYWMLLSQEDVSYCGVIDYLPGRLIDKAGDLTEPKLRAAVRTLERHKFVVVDKRTQELLIRSFIRHDGILARRNMGHACGRALGQVHSHPIRDAVLHELARLWAEDNTRDGWVGLRDYDPIAFDMACAMAFDMTRDEA